MNEKLSNLNEKMLEAKRRTSELKKKIKIIEERETLSAVKKFFLILKKGGLKISSSDMQNIAEFLLEQERRGQFVTAFLKKKKISNGKSA